MIDKKDMYFLTVVKSGSLSKAAETLYLSQPSLTKYIHALEQQLGVPLFLRNVKPLQLNAAGEIYYQYLQHQMAGEQDLHKKLLEADEGKRGKLRIGIPPIFGETLLPMIVPSFHEKYPQVQLEVREKGGLDLQQAVRENEIDLAFINVAAADVRGVEYTIFSKGHPYLAVHDRRLKLQSAGAEEREIDIRSMDASILPELQFILPRTEQVMHEYAVRLQTKYRFKPNVLLRSGQTNTALNLVSRIDRTAAFIAEYAIRSIPPVMRSRLIFYPLDDVDCRCDFMAIYSMDSSLSMFGRDMIRMAREVAGDLMFR